MFYFMPFLHMVEYKCQTQSRVLKLTDKKKIQTCGACKNKIKKVQ